MYYYSINVVLKLEKYILYTTIVFLWYWGLTNTHNN